MGLLILINKILSVDNRNRTKVATERASIQLWLDFHSAVTSVARQLLDCNWAIESDTDLAIYTQ